MTSLRLAIDAMGGDYAPAEIVAGAVAGARQHGVAIRLVGEPDLIDAELARHDLSGVEWGILPASEVVHMADNPSLAVRQKPDASISVACRAVQGGEADAVVTMGHTGAAMVAALFIFGRIPGIARPAVIVPFLGIQERMALIDAGANTEVEPKNLVQFAIMGSLYVEYVWGVNRPRVALLSNGSEANKGNAIANAAYSLLSESGLHFIGNAEGHDLPSGAADVVVHDGFAGNVVLKLSEGLTAEMLNRVEERLLRRSELDPTIVRAELDRLRAENHYARYGAVPLLGVNHLILIGHGRSKALAVRNAIGEACRAGRVGVVELIRAAFAAQPGDATRS